MVLTRPHRLPVEANRNKCLCKQGLLETGDVMSRMRAKSISTSTSWGWTHTLANTKPNCICDASQRLPSDKYPTNQTVGWTHRQTDRQAGRHADRQGFDQLIISPANIRPWAVGKAVRVQEASSAVSHLIVGTG